MIESECNHSSFVKNGYSQNKQRYKCKACGKSWQESYSYNACKKDTSKLVALLIKESCGIRSIARILKITTGSILKIIRHLSKNIKQPIISLYKEYEIDELRTYIQHKKNLYWVVSALEKTTGNVVAFAVGKRNNNTLNSVIKTVLNAAASKIHTDKLLQYQYLIPNALHSTKKFGTNKIERLHLNLRTHLKRLGRRTICYTKNVNILIACLKIYFWG
jgi:insertion element IS1 protein InsB